MWAMFVRPKVDGKLGAWRFEGFQQHDEIVTEIEEAVVEENGDGSFFSINIPEYSEPATKLPTSILEGFIMTDR